MDLTVEGMMTSSRSLHPLRAPLAMRLVRSGNTMDRR